MKIYFVGIHHKPGKEALDSSTLTGKIVDEVIASICKYTSAPCEKLNLFPTDYLPKGDEERRLVYQFLEKANNFERSDVVVLLSNQVHGYLANSIPANTILATHPARRGMNREEYVRDLRTQIVDAIHPMVAK